MMSRSHSRGFTLVEVSIAVLVLALSAGVVISTTG
ncbi:prepilin-type N-terminal cleavage/methylation domain-containing protein, partial [Myxococcota bacterium]|nr:prepilin-type N-terminal cleavage/methylation domain-containing protein [Myxococcota bacterium]